MILRLVLLVLFATGVPSLNAFAKALTEEKPVTLAGDLGSAVLYTPRNGQIKTGVIVVHEWWGLNDYARSRAQQLAEEGYAAIAVDMYGHGKIADHPKEATAFMNAALAEPDKMNARFQAAKAELEKLPQLDKVYAIGYCFGGAVVLNQARMGTDLAGVASFHGSLGTENPAEAGKVKAKVLVATGGADPMVPPKQVGDFVTEMGQAGVNLELLSFPGVLHSFTNPEATAKGEETGLPVAYDEAADKASWAALLRFLAE
ncbi:dienelactone hydrolase [Litorivivens lipolytica]|uniref:Dienelactone hydrolase n=1 Tax=Litorivivens lipolytica TaxID=1524264 RepID=A0A7W4W6U3_9GAMM|nr:dienelactone hydrolase family protein [Litorivivens lipolytica]MBB3048563.1 dienelactone hydrolase [Litorivivens lipolytica]